MKLRSERKAERLKTVRTLLWRSGGNQFSESAGFDPLASGIVNANGGIG